MHQWTPEVELVPNDQIARLASTKEELVSSYRNAVAATQHVQDAIESAQLQRQRAIAAWDAARRAGWDQRELEKLSCPRMQEVTWEPRDIWSPRPRLGAG